MILSKNTPLLNASLVFIPLSKNQIPNILNKEVIAIYDDFWNTSKENIDKILKENPNHKRYEFKMWVLKKVDNEYRWYEDWEDVTENIGTNFEAVKYFAFKPMIYSQNGSLANIQVR